MQQLSGSGSGFIYAILSLSRDEEKGKTLSVQCGYHIQQTGPALQGKTQLANHGKGFVDTIPEEVVPGFEIYPAQRICAHFGPVEGPIDSFQLEIRRGNSFLTLSFRSGSESGMTAKPVSRRS